MTEVDQTMTAADLSLEPPSLTDVFHRVNSLIPDDQDIMHIPPSTAAFEALELMREHRFSQLPVVQGSQVLGVVSFRSLASGMLGLGKEQVDLANLPVRDFIEKLDFVHVQEELRAILEPLDRDDAVLVGRPDGLQAIITPMDVLHYLYRVTSPFVLLAEIELSLRRLLQVCVSRDDLQGCIALTLSRQYEDRDLPSSLEEMTFNDYAQLVGDGRTWPRFQRVFGGSGDWQRKRTRAKLEEVRDLRNDVFHFKRELNGNDYHILLAHRDWLLILATEFEERAKAGE